MQCVSNLKQLGHAFNLYLSDWNGIYPSPGGLRGDWGYWSQSGNGGLVTYIGEPGGVDTIWCCPEMGEWNGYYPARTYSMNSYIRGTPDRDYPGSIYDKTGCPESYLEEPRRTILVFEGITVSLKTLNNEYDYIYRCGNWECVRGWRTEKTNLLHSLKSWQPWHGRVNDYLYADGHVRAFAPVKYKPGVNYPPLDIKYEWWVRKSVMMAK